MPGKNEKNKVREIFNSDDSGDVVDMQELINLVANGPTGDEERDGKTIRALIKLAGDKNPSIVVPYKVLMMLAEAASMVIIMETLAREDDDEHGLSHDAEDASSFVGDKDLENITKAVAVCSDVMLSIAIKTVRESERNQQRPHISHSKNSKKNQKNQKLQMHD